ncbi:hypothetical protein FIP36_17055 [Salmonella enterica]|nr:hypothetical protein [Salmonella enterica]
MKVKELISKLQVLDPEAVVVVAGFETQSSGYVAEVDAIKECLTTTSKEDCMQGNRILAKNGVGSVWIGWNNDYRTEYFSHAIEDPDELA